MPLSPRLPVLLLAMVFFALPQHAPLAQEAIFTSDVRKDLVGESAAEARKQALLEAEREGLADLLSRLAPMQDQRILDTLSDQKVSTMVRGMEVLDEKIAGNRYRALLRVSYDALAVNTLLDNNSVGAAGTDPSTATSPAVLVLPLYEVDGRLKLWEPENSWARAWDRVSLETSGGNVLAPYGDQRDMESVSSKALETAGFSLLEPLFHRYGVGQIAMIKAFVQREPLSLRIIKKDITPSRTNTSLLEYRADLQEDLNDLLYRVAHDLSVQIGRQREERLNALALGADAQDRIMMLVPLTTLESWVEARKTLLGLATVKKMDVLALSPQQVDIIVHYGGLRDLLVRDLQVHGFRVVENDNYLIVSRE